MKQVIALIIAVLLMVFSFSACRTIEDTKPKNETANPNIVYFV